MPRRQRKLESLLRKHGFVFHRQRKHRIYKDGEGRTFVVSTTPSDRQAETIAIKTLHRLLGISNRERIIQETAHPSQPVTSAEPVLEEQAAPTVQKLTELEELQQWQGEDDAARLQLQLEYLIDRITGLPANSMLRSVTLAECLNYFNINANAVPVASFFGVGTVTLFGGEAQLDENGKFTRFRVTRKNCPVVVTVGDELLIDPIAGAMGKITGFELPPVVLFYPPEGIEPYLTTCRPENALIPCGVIESGDGSKIMFAYQRAESRFSLKKSRDPNLINGIIHDAREVFEGL